MEASGDKALERGGDAAAAGCTAAWGISVGVEHDASRKPSAKVGRRQRDFSVTSLVTPFPSAFHSSQQAMGSPVCCSCARDHAMGRSGGATAARAIGLVGERVDALNGYYSKLV